LPKDQVFKKRTVILNTEQIEHITVSARANNREFSAQLRTIVDEDRAKVSAPRTRRSNERE